MVVGLGFLFVVVFLVWYEEYFEVVGDFVEDGVFVFVFEVDGVEVEVEDVLEFGFLFGGVELEEDVGGVVCVNDLEGDVVDDVGDVLVGVEFGGDVVEVELLGDGVGEGVVDGDGEGFVVEGLIVLLFWLLYGWVGYGGFEDDVGDGLWWKGELFVLCYWGCFLFKWCKDGIMSCYNYGFVF